MHVVLLLLRYAHHETVSLVGGVYHSVDWGGSIGEGVAHLREDYAVRRPDIRIKSP